MAIENSRGKMGFFSPLCLCLLNVCSNIPTKNDRWVYKMVSKFILSEFKDYKPFYPDIKSGKVVKVYDTDTITVIAPLAGDTWRFPVRLAGIDAPELRSKVEREAKLARAGRAYLAECILGTDVDLEVLKQDKYGRLLANVSKSGVNYSNLMIASGFARTYDGGHKDSWDAFFET